MSSFALMANAYRSIKQTTFVIACLFVFTEIKAQQDLFLFIESEGGTPFYANINNRHYGASAIGHLTLPNLRDTIYTVFIGVPASSGDLQTFRINMNRLDRGFLLKRSEGHWVLYDWKTPETIRAEVRHNDEARIERTDSFARLMASVVNDSDVLFTSIAKVEQKPERKDVSHAISTSTRDTADVKRTTDSTTVLKPPVIPPTEVQPMKDSSSVITTMPPLSGADTIARIEPANRDTLQRQAVHDSVSVVSSNSAVTKDTSVSARKNQGKQGVLEKEGITKVQEDDIKAGKQLVFRSVTAAGDIDTITILIPYSPGELKKIDTIRVKDTTTHRSAPDSLKSEPPRDTVVTTKIAVNRLDTVVTTKVAVKPRDTVVTTKVTVKPDCAKVAGDADVDRLRVKLLLESDVDERVSAARKAFMEKCYTCHQVRALTELFPGDEARYKFFDAAYRYVSDAGNFGALADLITDPYYRNRFKAMLR